jgi:hypothetical protein
LVFLVFGRTGARTQGFTLAKQSFYFLNHASNLKRPSFKNKDSRARGKAQVVEHLPSKYKAISSNPSTAK